MQPIPTENKIDLGAPGQSRPAVSFTLGIQAGLITLAFDREITSVGLDPQGARELAFQLRKRADQLEHRKPARRRKKSK